MQQNYSIFLNYFENYDYHSRSSELFHFFQIFSYLEEGFRPKGCHTITIGCLHLSCVVFSEISRTVEEVFKKFDKILQETRL